MNKTYVIGFCILLSACSMEVSEIKSARWKQCSGEWIGCDVLDYNVLSIKNDTIFKSNVAMCRIVSSQKGFLMYKPKIEIESIRTKKKANYVVF
jgi:hypothetical protein